MVIFILFGRKSQQHTKQTNAYDLYTFQLILFDFNTSTHIQRCGWSMVDCDADFELSHDMFSILLKSAINYFAGGANRIGSHLRIFLAYFSSTKLQ